MTPFFGRLGETVRGLVGDFWRLFFFCNFWKFIVILYSSCRIIRILHIL